MSISVKGTCSKPSVFNRASMEGEFLKKLQFGSRRLGGNVHGRMYNLEAGDLKDMHMGKCIIWIYVF
jgi:hypothetical protein